MIKNVFLIFLIIFCIFIFSCKVKNKEEVSIISDLIEKIKADSIGLQDGIMTVKLYNYNPKCYVICFHDSTSTAPDFQKIYELKNKNIFFDENFCKTNLEISEQTNLFEYLMQLFPNIYNHNIDWGPRLKYKNCWFYMNGEIINGYSFATCSDFECEKDEKFHKKLETLHEYKLNGNLEVFIDSFEKAYVNDRPKPFYISQLRENPKVVEIRLLEFFDDYNRLKTAYYDKNKNHIIYDLNLRPKNTKRLTEKVSWSKLSEYYPDFDKEVEIDPSNSFYNDREWYIIDDHYLFNEVDSLKKYRSLDIVGEKLSKIIESYCR